MYFLFFFYLFFFFLFIWGWGGWEASSVLYSRIGWGNLKDGMEGKL